jgi:hypothetical protein
MRRSIIILCLAVGAAAFAPVLQIAASTCGVRARGPAMCAAPASDAGGLPATWNRPKRAGARRIMRAFCWVVRQLQSSQYREGALRGFRILTFSRCAQRASCRGARR